MMRNVVLFCLVAGVAATASVAPLAADETPNFSGMWGRTGEPMMDPVPGAKEATPVLRLQVDSKDAEEIMAGNWANPMLQPWAREVVRKNALSEIALKHVYQADDSCWPMTVPAIINLREAVQVLQTKDRITFMYQRDHQVRRIWLNQDHRPDFKPDWYGESVGRFEGDTLVVDTVGIKTHAMSFVDPFGTPHTDKLHVVERYRVIADKAGKGLEVVVTVEDPGTFTMPWTGRSVYRPNRADSIVEVICAENNVTFNGQTFGPLPTQNAPQF